MNALQGFELGTRIATMWVITAACFKYLVGT